MTVKKIEFASAFFVLTIALTIAGNADKREETHRLLSEALEATDQDDPVLLKIEVGSEGPLAYFGPKLLSSFLGTDEVYILLNQYPVTCDGSETESDSFLECFRFNFDSKSSGTVRYQLSERDDLVVDGYWKAPFEVTDDGICLDVDGRESDVEIEILDAEDMVSVMEADAVRSIFEVSDSKARSCFSFSYPEGGDTLQHEMIINQVLISDVIDEDARYYVNVSPMVMSDAWPFEP